MLAMPTKAKGVGAAGSDRWTCRTRRVTLRYQEEQDGGSWRLSLLQRRRLSLLQITRHGRIGVDEAPIHLLGRNGLPLTSTLVLP
jgi:hypothetical protein